MRVGNLMVALFFFFQVAPLFAQNQCNHNVLIYVDASTSMTYYSTAEPDHNSHTLPAIETAYGQVLTAITSTLEGESTLFGDGTQIAFRNFNKIVTPFPNHEEFTTLDGRNRDIFISEVLRQSSGDRSSLNSRLQVHNRGYDFRQALESIESDIRSLQNGAPTYVLILSDFDGESGYDSDAFKRQVRSLLRNTGDTQFFLLKFEDVDMKNDVTADFNPPQDPSRVKVIDIASTVGDADQLASAITNSINQVSAEITSDLKIEPEITYRNGKLRVRFKIENNYCNTINIKSVRFDAIKREGADILNSPPTFDLPFEVMSGDTFTTEPVVPIEGYNIAQQGTKQVANSVLEVNWEVDFTLTMQSKGMVSFTKTANSLVSSAEYVLFKEKALNYWKPFLNKVGVFSGLNEERVQIDAQVEVGNLDSEKPRKVTLTSKSGRFDFLPYGPDHIVLQNGNNSVKMWFIVKSLVHDVKLTSSEEFILSIDGEPEEFFITKTRLHLNESLFTFPLSAILAVLVYFLIRFFTPNTLSGISPKVYGLQWQIGFAFLPEILRWLTLLIIWFVATASVNIRPVTVLISCLLGAMVMAYSGGVFKLMAANIYDQRMTKKPESDPDMVMTTAIRKSYGNLVVFIVILTALITGFLNLILSYITL